MRGGNWGDRGSKEGEMSGGKVRVIRGRKIRGRGARKNEGIVRKWGGGIENVRGNVARECNKSKGK